VAVDPDEEALARSRAAGADIAVKPRDAQLGRLDVVVHANSDESSLALSCDLADKLGRVVLLGTPAGQDVALPDFLDRIVIPEREIIGTDSKNPHEYREAIKLMSSGDEDWDIRKPRRVSMAEAPAILRRAAESWPLEADMFIEMRQH
jgi:threonine dehydrogenase-like Zn-dependent dehydrogenase